VLVAVVVWDIREVVAVNDITEVVAVVV
jgi:hypothetical protein